MAAHNPRSDPSGYPLPLPSSSSSSSSHSHTAHTLPPDHEDPWAASSALFSGPSSKHATPPVKRHRSESASGPRASGSVRPSLEPGLDGSPPILAHAAAPASATTGGFPSHPLTALEKHSFWPSYKGKARAVYSAVSGEGDDDDADHDGARDVQTFAEKVLLHKRMRQLAAASAGGGKDVSNVLAIWARLVESSNGRDKLLKVVQYSARTYLYILSVLLAPRMRVLWAWILRRPENGKGASAESSPHMAKIKALVSGLSLARKCLLLFTPLLPLSHLLSTSPISGPKFMDHILSLLSGCADDVHCLSKLGMVGPRRGKWAETWASRLWLLRSIVELSKLHSTVLPSPVKLASPPIADFDPTRRRRAREVHDAEWSARKLYLDVVFASYDVFSWSLLKEPVQCIAGLAAGLISTSKLYDKHALQLPG